MNSIAPAFGALAGERSLLASAMPSSPHGTLVLGKGASLAKGRVHEVQGDSADIFALIVASQLSGPIVWIGTDRALASLAPTGAQIFIDPGRLLLVEGITRLELLWAGEQALRCKGLACVIMDLDQGPDLQESRRLQIACEESGVTGIVLIRGRAHTSTAETRWDCHATEDGGWAWACTKNRKGEIGTWHIWWRGKDGPDPIHMAATASA